MTRLEVIERTISTLLEKGADINKILVPIPGMFLALFSGKAAILKKTLDSGGWPNTTLSEEVVKHYLAILFFKYI